jgi:hypothetical protein
MCHDRKREATSVADLKTFDLIKETAKAIKSWKLMDRDYIGSFYHCQTIDAAFQAFYTY